VRATLRREAFKAAWAQGRAMPLTQAIEYALQTSLEREQPRTARQVEKRRYGGLTPRERQVAALFAQGKSNREIAAALVLSERTITTHVANVLSKLGFSSRTQIAAWAVEKGLVNRQS
jgi:non-specific serine/threonine protein kinase